VFVVISSKLVQLIEDHAERIADRVVREHHRDPRLGYLARLPESELRGRAEEILKRLGHWLAESNEEEIRRHFESIGRERYLERVPLEEVVLGHQMVKQRMLDYIRDQGIGMSTVELYAEEELEHQVGVFFDAVVYYVVRGYQQAVPHLTARAG
jgi:hypothetical protein